MTAKILIVDDIKFNIDILETKLQKECYEIYRASNGQEALSKAIEIRPDIILMDIMMPLMDGLTTTKAIRRTPEISFTPIIIVTALDSDEDKVSSLLCEADDYIVKPINYSILIARIKSLLRTKFITEELVLRLKADYGAEQQLQSLAPTLNIDTKGAQILLIDDNTSQASIVSNKLRSTSFVVDVCLSVNEAVLKNSNHDYSLIIINIAKESRNSIESCIKIRNSMSIKHIPLMVLIDRYEEELLLKSLEIGMNDYALMPLNINELSAKATLQVKRFKHQEKLRLMCFEMSATDDLTGLYNRKHLNSYFSQIIKKIQNENKSYTLCILDIDNFKLINDVYGHITGDNVLKSVAKIISSNIRSIDFIARFGGEEFVVVLHDVTKNQALLIIEKIKQKLTEVSILDLSKQNAIRCTISTGIDEIKGDDTLQMAVDRADKKLYHAKALGRDTIVS
jgi:two-component system cell cycle response regulator